MIETQNNGNNNDLCFSKKNMFNILDNHNFVLLFVRYPRRCLKLGLENVLILQLMYGISQVWYSMTR
jgi:hypothetical protein